MIDDGWNLVVRADREEGGRHLLALADVHRENFVLQSGLFEEDRDLVTIRRGPVVEIDHGGDPVVGSETCVCMNLNNPDAKSMVQTAIRAQL